jgi:predicted enzyme related to lactoylglutathione lyase
MIVVQDEGNDEDLRMSETITVHGVYAAAVVSNLEAVLPWYEKFLGRPADDLPIPGMAQWRDLGAAGLQVWQDEARAGNAIMTIVVPDLAREKERLAAAGLVLENEAEGAFGKIGQLFDPEGNRINLAEPPKGFAQG